MMAPTRSTPSSGRSVVVGAAMVVDVDVGAASSPEQAATLHNATSTPTAVTRRDGTRRVYEMAAS
jgi:hypothetical protein